MWVFIRHDGDLRCSTLTKTFLHLPSAVQEVLRAESIHLVLKCPRPPLSELPCLKNDSPECCQHEGFTLFLLKFKDIDMSS